MYALQVMQRSYKARKNIKVMYLFLEVRLNLINIYKFSLSLRPMGLLAVSRIVKQEGAYKLLEEGDSEKCEKICEFLLLIVCSSILVEQWRLLSPI